MFKLGQSSDMSSPIAEECVQLATQALRILETQLDTSAVRETSSCLTYDVFPGHSIHEPLMNPYSYAAWLYCVTLLWRITMGLKYKSSSWDELTCKLLATRWLTEMTNEETCWIQKHAASLQCVYAK